MERPAWEEVQTRPIEHAKTRSWQTRLDIKPDEVSQRADAPQIHSRGREGQLATDAGPGEAEAEKSAEATVVGILGTLAF